MYDGLDPAVLNAADIAAQLDRIARSLKPARRQGGPGPRGQSPNGVVM